MFAAVWQSILMQALKLYAGFLSLCFLLFKWIDGIYHSDDFHAKRTESKLTPMLPSTNLWSKLQRQIKCFRNRIAAKEKSRRKLDTRKTVLASAVRRTRPAHFDSGTGIFAVNFAQNSKLVFSNALVSMMKVLWVMKITLTRKKGSHIINMVSEC